MPDNPAASLFREYGRTGLKTSYGQVIEEYLPQLSGYRACKVYREMGDNDPIIGALLYAIKQELRRLSWTTEGPHASFIEDARNDMSHTWEDFIAEALSMVQYGWAYHEICYKPRMDGRIGWRKLPVRGQDTLRRWEIDTEGGIHGMWQVVGGVAETLIPIEKAVHFRTTHDKNNPEGRSFLRNAYRPWWYKKRIEEIEAIGVERDLAGIPVAKVPAEMLASDRDSNMTTAFEAIKEIVVNLRNDEQAGVVWPRQLDDHGNDLYDLSLMSSGGRRAFVTGDIITRKNQEIATTVLFDVLLLGHERVGSYALAGSKEDLATMGLQAIADEIASVMTRWAIPRLLELNGLSTDVPTRLVPGELKPANVQVLSEALWKLAMAGMPLFPSQTLEHHVRRMLDLPDSEGDEISLPELQHQAQTGGDEEEDEDEEPEPAVEKSTDRLVEAFKHDQELVERDKRIAALEHDLRALRKGRSLHVVRDENRLPVRIEVKSDVG